MIGTAPASSGFTLAKKATLEMSRLPAPNKGVDTRGSIGDMSSQNCVYCFNLVPNEYGLKVRFGYREWQIGVEDTLAFGASSIVVYDGLETDPSDNRLFVTNNEGIWDCTIEGAAPVKMATFSIDTSTNAGHGVFAQYIDSSGEEFLYYADSTNGLWQFTKASNAWVVATGITGVDVPSGAVLDLTKVAFIVVHKQRIWLVEQDSDIGWYLPIASRLGECSAFFFGPKFPHGGKLIALINWSVDGGAGVDDYLVALATSGDLIPYQGADPEAVEGGGSTTDVGWSVRGTYFIGKLPRGRKFFSEYSGELYILSSFGLIAMSDLLRGVDPSNVASASLTFPIASVLRPALVDSHFLEGWEPMFVPSQGQLLITSPANPLTGIYLQYVMNLSLEAWGFWRGVPMISVAEWDNRVFFGTADNRIMVMDNTRDNALLDVEDDAHIGAPIEFSLLTSYTDGGSPAQFKIPAFVRTDWITELPVVYETKIFFDYEIGEIPITLPELPQSEVAVWDVGTWDFVIWGGGVPTNQNNIDGQSGIGRSMAVALRGTSTDFARLMSFDVMWNSGGAL